MKTLREFAEDVLNQVTTGTGYLGEKAENNGKITVCISIRKLGSMVGPMIKLEGYYEEYKESQNICISDQIMRKVLSFRRK